MINQGQFGLSGHYWEVEACTGPKADNTIEPATPLPLPPRPTRSRATTTRRDRGRHRRTTLDADSGRLAPPPSTRPGPHCNVRGLTDLGRKLIDRMIDERLLIEVDHMSVKARDAAMEILRKRDYSGVLSATSGATSSPTRRSSSVGGHGRRPGQRRRGLRRGLREVRADGRTPKYFFGWGFGPDANGLGTCPHRARTRTRSATRSRRSAAEVTLDRQVSGQRTYDVNTDGDRPLRADPRLGRGRPPRRRRAGSPATCSAAPRPTCRPGSAPTASPPRAAGRSERGSAAAASARSRSGAPPSTCSRRAGQPALRKGSAYTLLREGRRRRGRGRVQQARADRGRRERAAPGTRPGGIEVGDRTKELRERARTVGGGLWIERTPPGNRRFVYRVRGRRGEHRRGRLAARRPQQGKLFRYLKPLR